MPGHTVVQVRLFALLHHEQPLLCWDNIDISGCIVEVYASVTNMNRRGLRNRTGLSARKHRRRPYEVAVQNIA